MDDCLSFTDIKHFYHTFWFKETQWKKTLLVWPISFWIFLLRVLWFITTEAIECSFLCNTLKSTFIPVFSAYILPHFPFCATFCYMLYHSQHFQWLFSDLGRQQYPLWLDSLWCNISVLKMKLCWSGYRYKSY